ncbi:hypothetical protein MUK70_26530 [Dyadobacter chenwenxiniae]|uniref:Uncharacterized protein n=1 Tax=Dyadobacter chenwenxiniae TaxID=2906456 RepID=A0A9X1TFC2_9BACT|nr:hypothetical protein [Dyadobacter chenwenxiniae]MCF0064211.1 hypothetical protein [Dyadobacter chenwenxiniae]UON82573.1 hypothetical protein MUK70_26530 [Dyadobacter chenwenxiniae]
MRHHYYPYLASEDYLSFTFKSISEKRIICKKAEFLPISDDIYNFAFGDLADENAIDDRAVTDNKDMNMVLATIIQILLEFLETHKNKAVYFQGSTTSRTRMYQIILRREKPNWENRLIVYGIFNDEIMPYETDFSFDAFIVKQKPN